MLVRSIIIRKKKKKMLVTLNQNHTCNIGAAMNHILDTPKILTVHTTAKILSNRKLLIFGIT